MDMDRIQEEYFNFEGRINRKVYIIRSLILFAISFILGLILGFLGDFSGGLIYFAIWVVGAIATFAQHVKRLHDLGKNGWWSLLMFVPFVNLALVIYMVFIKGNEFTNEYGPDPLSNDIYI